MAYERADDALAAYLSDPADVAAAGAAAGRAVQALRGDLPTSTRPAPMRDHLLMAEERLMRLRERGSSFGVPSRVGPVEWFLLGTAAVHTLAAIAQALEGGVRNAIEFGPPRRPAAPTQTEGTD